MQMELSLRNLRESVEKEQKPMTEEGAGLLRRIRGGEPAAEQEFTRLYSDGIRFYLRRRLGPEDLEARTQWLLAKLLGRVRQGWSPPAGGIAGFLAEATHDWGCPSESPATLTASRKANSQIRAKAENLKSALRGCSARELEMLIRYYVNGQDLDQLTAQMGITPDEIMSLKRRLRRLAAEHAHGHTPLTRAAGGS